MEALILRVKSVFIPCEENKYRPKFLESRFLSYYLIVLLILKIISVSVLFYLPQNVFFADITKSALINLTNQERNSLGIQTLKENLLLEDAAYLKARDILEKGYFSHYSPEGVSPWYWFEVAGYKYKFAGENLAIGFLDSEEVNQAWLDSASHRTNILNPKYKEVGIAVTKGDFQGNKTTIVVQLFGVLKTQEIKEEVKTKTVPQVISEQKDVEPEKEQAVLSAASPSPEEKKTEEKLSFKLFSFLDNGYFNLLQMIIYLSLIFVSIALIVNIFVKFNIQHKDLIFKTLGFIVLLGIFYLFDKGVILQTIPHGFSIY